MTQIESTHAHRSFSSRRLSRQKRLAFGAALALMMFATLEGLSYLALRWYTGLTLENLWAQQRVMAAAGHSLQAPQEAIHPYLGRVLNPDISPGADLFGRHVGVNPLGFNDVDHAIPKRRPDRLAIAIVGGSVAWQMSVLGEDVLRERLGRDPRYAQSEIEIVRLALSGHKQPQQLMALAWLLSLGAEFDAVINIDGYNEIALPMGENIHAGLFLAYPRMWHTRMEELVDPRMYATAFRLFKARGGRQQLAADMVQSRLRWSPTWNLVWYVRDRSWERELVATGFAITRFRTGDTARFAALGPTEHFADDDEALARCAEIWQASSQQIARLCLANGCAYLHVLQPNQYVAGSKPMGDEERRAMCSGNRYSPYVEKGYPLLVRAGQSLRDQGIAFHDLTMLFSDVPEPLYADKFCHYNARGNELLAEAVAERLLEAFDGAE
jgi:hypothetical protein